LKRAYEARSLIQHWIGKARGYHQVIEDLEELTANVKVSKLSQEEVPILRTISTKVKEGTTNKESLAGSAKFEAKLSAKPELKASAGVDSFDESVADNELYQEYADAVLRSFPFQDLLARSSHH
jgi:hypothetical protein